MKDGIKIDLILEKRKDESPVGAFALLLCVVMVFVVAIIFSGCGGDKTFNSTEVVEHHDHNHKSHNHKFKGDCEAVIDALKQQLEDCKD